MSNVVLYKRPVDSQTANIMCALEQIIEDFLRERRVKH